MVNSIIRRIAGTAGALALVAAGAIGATALGASVGAPVPVVAHDAYGLATGPARVPVVSPAALPAAAATSPVVTAATSSANSRTADPAHQPVAVAPAIGCDGSGHHCANGSTRRGRSDDAPGPGQRSAGRPPPHVR